jgi:hypothetical protein
MRDRPLDASLRERASNHLKPLSERAMVVSVEEKVGPEPVR